MRCGVGFRGGGGAKPILVELEEGCYAGPVLPVSLVDLVAGRRSVGVSAPKSGSGSRNGGGGGGGGGNKKPFPKVDFTRVPAQVWARYDAHLPSLSFRNG